MKKLKMLISGLVMVSMLFTLSGCGSQPTGQQGETSTNTPAKVNESQISIGTAAAGGVFYPLGVGMAKVIQDKIPGMKATAEETGGDRENASLMAQKKIELGMITTFTAAQALNGEAPYKEPVKMQLGWKLFNDPITFIVMKSSPIKTMKDLKGKKISLGSAGAASNAAGVEILKTYGIGEKDFTPLFQGWSEAADGLADGQIDCITVMGGIPVPAVTGLAASKEIRILAADAQTLEPLAKKGIYTMDLPPNTYKGQTESIVLPNPWAYIWFRTDMSEETVYKITKAIFENIDYLKTVHPTAAKMELPNSKNTLGEVHPGVKKYVQEIGKW